MPTREAICKIIIEAAREYKGGLKGLSEAIGRNHAYFQQFVTQGKPRHLPEPVRDLLAPLIGKRPEDLKVTMTQPPPPTPLRPETRPSSPDSWPIDVPIQRTHHIVVPDGGADFYMSGEGAGFVKRPPGVMGAAFAIYMHGSKMEPVYEPGDPIYVDPDRPLRPGDYVLVEILSEDERRRPALVRRLVEENDRGLVVEQFNPRKTETIEHSRIRAKFYIPRYGRLFG